MQIATPSLSKARLGQAGPLVGVQGLGCMGMSEFYGDTNALQARATLDRALSLGVTLFDTADMYGLGANETLLGPFLRANREHAVVATKFGYTRTADRPDDWTISNRPDYIRRAVDGSLKRMGVDIIDLYYMHRRTSDVPLDESIGAMAELVEVGKVRAIGLCEVSAEELRLAHAIHPIAALQSEWSVFSRQIEREVAPVAAELGIAVVPYAPLGRGLLTGRAFSEGLVAKDVRNQFPRFQAENREANSHLVSMLDGMSSALGVSTAQLALAWLYARARQLGVTVIPIPGTRRPDRLEANVAATRIELSDQEMATIEPLAKAVQGAAV